MDQTEDRQRVAEAYCDASDETLAAIDRDQWQPGDPVYRNDSARGRHHCGPCGVSWTADVDRCWQCGELSTPMTTSGEA